MDGKLQRHLDFTPGEQPDAVLGAPQHPAPNQGLDVDRIFGVESAAIDCGLDAVEVHLVEFKREDVTEAALRQPPMQRHLAAFEALDAHACTRGLALAAATARLPLPGPDAAAHPHTPLAGPRVSVTLIKLLSLFLGTERLTDYACHALPHRSL